MRYRADELAVLDDRRARHECGQVGTTHFYNFLTVSTPFVKKIVLCSSILAYFATHTEVNRVFPLDFIVFVSKGIPWTIPRGKF